MLQEDLPLLPQIKESFRDTADFQTITIGEIDGQALYLCYLSTLVAPDRLSFTLENEIVADHLSLESLLNRVLGQKVMQIDSIQQCEQALFDGKTLLCTSILNQILALYTQQVQSRGIQSPVAENVNRGPMYAFNEDYSACGGLIRQRLRTTDLKLWETTVGSISKTKVGVCTYIRKRNMK